MRPDGAGRTRSCHAENSAGIRVARRSRALEECARFYRDDVGLPQLFEFHDHEGYDGFVFALHGASVQLELVRPPVERRLPAPDDEDLIVIYVASEEDLDTARGRLELDRGLSTLEPANPYWQARRAFIVLDPEGRGVMYVVGPEDLATA